MAEKSKLTVAAEIAAIVGCSICAIGVYIAWLAYRDSNKPAIAPSVYVATGATMLVSKVAIYCFMATVALTVTASILFFIASRRRSKSSGLFTALQVEAFQLAKDLRDFLKEIGAHPEITKANGELDHRAAVKYTEWSARLIKGYDGRFVPEIRSISAKVGEVPLTSCYELDFWTKGIKSELEVRLCAQTLERIAIELGSIGELRYSRCEVEAMEPLELSQTAEAYPGFTELVNYYSRK
jgi:hypothetical protein